jgi:ribosomal protein S18
VAKSVYEFIKVEQRLFNDPRYFMLDEFDQLVYIKLISLMKQTKNKIPRKIEAINDYMRCKRPSNDLEMTIKRLLKTFDNFKKNKHFYYFTDFEKRYGYGTSKKGVEEDKEEEKEKEHLNPFALTTKNLKHLKGLFDYDKDPEKLKRYLIDEGHLPEAEVVAALEPKA